ncbi:MAG: solute carrier family 26 protein [Alphaproteobacteria bacterium]|nr:solute carrier family 26 protein [Alphaproteobacteria bacterium]
MLGPLSRHLPLLGQLRGYDGTAFKGDVAAGLTTAIMLIPQGMAYAMLAGLDPIIGLYASTLPLVVYALFGTSRQLAVGPVAMVSLLVASGVGAIVGPDGDPLVYAGYAALLALMVGVMQLLMGVVRLGFLVKFLSHPVIAGFTSAAALIIGLSQLKHVLGVNIASSHYVHEIILSAIEKAGEIQPITLGIAVASVVTLTVLKKVAPRFPRFLLVVVGGTLAVWGLGLDSQGVAIVGSVPDGFPGPRLPSLSLDAVTQLLPVAVTISLVGFMESISVAKNFARQNGYEVDADQELKGLGFANIVGSVFQGYPVTGGFSRTAVNAQAGAVTGMASVITGVVVALTLVFLTPLFYFLPKAVLAAIIMTAVFGLIDVKEARHLWHVSRSDLAMMGLTFVATLTLGIEQGILVGVAASLVWFVWSTSKPHVAVLGRLPGSTVYRNVDRYDQAQCTPGVLALRIDAPLFFANTLFLKRTLQELEGQMDHPLRHLVLDAKGIGSVDASGDGVLHEIIDEYRSRGVQVWFAGMRGPVRDVLRRSGLLAKVGEEHLVHRVHEAVDAIAPPPRLELAPDLKVAVGGEA